MNDPFESKMLEVNNQDYLLRDETDDDLFPWREVSDGTDIIIEGDHWHGILWMWKRRIVLTPVQKKVALFEHLIDIVVELKILQI
jgi:hypothetical protein